MQSSSSWDGIAMPGRLWAILAVMFAVSLSVLDGVIVNIALPTICDGLQITPSRSIWIINSYQIAIVISLLPFSALGDLVGYRRVYFFGLALFTIMSGGCAASWSLESLVACRVLQGFGASAIMSVNTSIVRLIFPRKMLGRALGLNSTVVSVSAVGGPTLAALILSFAEWPWLFAVNLPVGCVALMLGYLFLPDNPERSGGGRAEFRWGDAALNAITFGSVFALVTGYSQGFDWWWLVLFGFIAAFVGRYYVGQQLRRENPILPFDLLRIPIFSLSVATSILTFVAQMSMIVSLPFILQRQFGYSPVEVGAILTAWPAMNMCTTPISGFLVERYHAGILGCIGLATLCAGLLLLAFVPVDATKIDFMWRLALCGFGFGFFQAPNNSLIISSAPLSRSGSASGMMATARLTGQIAGAASVALLFYIVPEESANSILFVGVLFAGLAAILSFSRLSLPMPTNGA
ncbi:MAG: MFS transporter [Rikenellaceae bacterium]